jgi:hypothetical protein
LIQKTLAYSVASFSDDEDVKFYDVDARGNRSSVVYSFGDFGDNEHNDVK